MGRWLSFLIVPRLFLPFQGVFSGDVSSAVHIETWQAFLKMEEEAMR